MMFLKSARRGAPAAVRTARRPPEGRLPPDPLQRSRRLRRRQRCVLRRAEGRPAGPGNHPRRRTRKAGAQGATGVGRLRRLPEARLPGGSSATEGSCRHRARRRPRDPERALSRVVSQGVRQLAWRGRRGNRCAASLLDGRDGGGHSWGEASSHRHLLRHASDWAKESRTAKRCAGRCTSAAFFNFASTEVRDTHTQLTKPLVGGLESLRACKESAISAMGGMRALPAARGRPARGWLDHPGALSTPATLSSQARARSANVAAELGPSCLREGATPPALRIDLLVRLKRNLRAP